MISGPWNEGTSTRLGEEFQYIDDPIRHVMETNGLVDQKPAGTTRTEQEVQEMNKSLSEERSTEINAASPIGMQQWNTPETVEDTSDEPTEQKQKPQSRKNKR